MVTLKCPKCGAPFEYEPGMKFKKCEYCGTMIYIDKSRVMFYYIIPFSIGDGEVASLFKRWASGSRMAKGLENSLIKSINKLYFPVYRFVRDVNNKEKVIIKPANTTLLSGLTNLKIPPGNMKIFDTNFNTGNAKVVQPELSMDTYLKGLPGNAKEQELVFFPIYEVRYEFNGKEYSVVMDGSTGEIFTSYYPPRSSLPYIFIGSVVFILSLIGASLAVIGYTSALLLIGVAFLIGVGGGYIVAKKF